MNVASGANEATAAAPRAQPARRHAAPRPRAQGGAAGAAGPAGQALSSSGSHRRPSRRAVIRASASAREPRAGPPPPAAATLQAPATEAAVAGETSSAAALRALLASPLPPHPLLVRRTLSNGLRIVLLPNGAPPDRFEAHLEIHAGSVDEGVAEQGVAHFVEHVVFLGSRKRERLLGTGARSNAYTDFHHTVFHVHSPGRSGEGEPLLPAVLEALVDIAFQPLFLDSRVEKERRAVLAEAQMMNTIEYRVDCQLLARLHWENALGERFPIGQSDQIAAWPTAALKAFHTRWYFPGNATLYLVGDFEGGPEAALAAAVAAFDPVPAPDDPVTGGLRRRHVARPPVRHVYGVPRPQSEAEVTATGALPGAVWADLPPAASVAAVSVFQHELLQQFTLSWFAKLPARPCTTHGELRRVFAARVLVSVLQFRASSAANAAGCPFVSLDLDHSDSGREGCAVSTLTLVCEPAAWRPAVRAACAQARLLARHGVQASEVARYAAAMLRDSEQLAAQAGAVPSLDNLDFVMESDALGHTVMDQLQGHEALKAIAASVTVAEVNALAAELLGYVADFGLPAGEADPRGSICTAVVACVPAAAPADCEDPDSPLQPFVVSDAEIRAVLCEAGAEHTAAAEVVVPDHLLEPSAVDALLATLRPRFVPLDGSPPPPDWTPPPPDATGLAQRRLSNGLRINWRVSDNEPAGAAMRLVAPGGRFAERPSAPAAVALGSRAMSEAGTAGPWERAQVELFCVSRLLNCLLEADEEFLALDAHVAVPDGGLRAAFELLHLMLAQPRWEEGALARAKAMYVTHARALHKSLERATSGRLLAALTGNDRRFCDPSEAEIAAVTLEQARDAVAAQLAAGCLELSVVGDFDGAELDELALRFLGSVTPPPPADASLMGAPEAPLVLAQLPLEDPLRHQRLHLKDSDERAIAYAAGAGPNGWGWGFADEAAAAAAYAAAGGSPLADGPLGGAAPGAPPRLAQLAARRGHPLYAGVTSALLAEVVNSRLFTTVRDALGLTYDVSFELSSFDRLSAGWYLLSVSSTPAKIDEALAASLRTLRGVATSRISGRELERARRMLLTRHESDSKDNKYLLSLLTHCQQPGVPAKGPLAAAPAEVRDLLMSATVADLYAAFASLRLGACDVLTCVGTSGEAPPPVPSLEALQPSPPLGSLDLDGGAQAAARAAVAAMAGGELAALVAAMQRKQQLDGQSG